MNVVIVVDAGRIRRVLLLQTVRVVNTPDTLAGFASLDILRPSTSQDIPATIARLREKRAFYDTLPRDGIVHVKESAPLATHDDGGNDDHDNANANDDELDVAGKGVDVDSAASSTSDAVANESG